MATFYRDQEYADILASINTVIHYPLDEDGPYTRNATGFFEPTVGASDNLYDYWNITSTAGGSPTSDEPVVDGGYGAYVPTQSLFLECPFVATDTSSIFLGRRQAGGNTQFSCGWWENRQYQQQVGTNGGGIRSMAGFGNDLNPGGLAFVYTNTLMYFVLDPGESGGNWNVSGPSTVLYSGPRPQALVNNFYCITLDVPARRVTAYLNGNILYSASSVLTSGYEYATSTRRWFWKGGAERNHNSSELYPPVPSVRFNGVFAVESEIDSTTVQALYNAGKI
jgi:hypothetical protein